MVTTACFDQKIEQDSQFPDKLQKSCWVCCPATQTEVYWSFLHALAQVQSSPVSQIKLYRLEVRDDCGEDLRHHWMGLKLFVLFRQLLNGRPSAKDGLGGMLVGCSIL